MAKRSDELIQDFMDLLGLPENQVLFQPSSNVHLVYPCVIIERETSYQPHANDKSYLFRPGYKCMYINRREPEPEEIQMIIERFPMCAYRNHYVADNLHHDVFLIY